MKHKQDWTARIGRRRPDSAKSALTDSVGKLDALRASIIDAASVSGALWVSYLFVLLYLLIATGSVTHRDLFLENPIKMPFLSVELPLLGFFVLGPLLFLIVHAYVLLNLALLADKVVALNVALRDRITDRNVREGIRRELPNNIFVQILAGARGVRSGLIGFFLRSIVNISLVMLPLALLMFFELQFLPYHDQVVSWWHRLALVFDLLILWLLWPRIVRGKAGYLTWRDLKNWKVILLSLASAAPVVLMFAIATFPGEWLDEEFVYRPGAGWGDIRAEDSDWTALHKLMVGGDIDSVTRRPKSLWSNVLILPGLDIGSEIRFDSAEKIEQLTTTMSLRGRDLTGAILSGARLPKADFTGAKLTGVDFVAANLDQARFLCAYTTLLVGGNLADSFDEQASLPQQCAELRTANFTYANLRGAALDGANARNSDFSHARMQGATLDGADLRGDTFYSANLEGGSLDQADLALAQFNDARMRGASLTGAILINSTFGSETIADLRDTDFDEADLRGASFYGVDLQGASMRNACVWGLYPQAQWSNLRVERLDLKRHQARPCNQPIDEETRSFLNSPYTAIPDTPRSRAFLAAGWAAVQQQSPNAASFAALLEKDLIEFGCTTDDAPFVLHGLTIRLASLQQESVFSAGKAAVIPLGKMAARFLDRASCPNAAALSDDDRAELESIAASNRASASAAPAASPDR